MAHPKRDAVGPRPAGRPNDPSAPSAPSAAVLTPPTGLPAVPQQRPPSEPAGPTPPAAPIAPDESGLRLCTCGHPEEMHEHYRPGTDCGACGSRSCAAFHRTGDGDATQGVARRLLRRWTG